MGLHLSGSTVASLAGTFARLVDVQSTRTTDGALVAGAHNPVDATSGNRTVTLADAASAGLLVAVSKKDATANTVTVSVAHLRDGGAGSIVLVGQFEALLLTSKADGTWWPVGDHKTKAYLDATYVAKSATVNTQAGSYTLALADAGGAVDVTSASAATVTVPTNASVAFPVGTLIEVSQLGAGKVTIGWAGGVTINSAGSVYSVGAQYATVGLRKTATNTWLLTGYLVA